MQAFGVIDDGLPLAVAFVQWVTTADEFTAKWGAEADVNTKNGNLIKNLNKNILGIRYNTLSLSTSIVFANGDTITCQYYKGRQQAPDGVQDR